MISLALLTLVSAPDGVFYLHTGAAELEETAAEDRRPSFYLPENGSRYTAYMDAASVSLEDAVRLVNADADLEFYKNVTEIDDPGDLLVLTTKNRRLPRDYVPDNLRAVCGTNVLMREEAADALERMNGAMKDEGLSVVPVSGYRSYYTQRQLFDTRIREYGSAGAAERDTARAGHSEHQTGLAVDILHKIVRPLGAANFQRTEHYKWLTDHAHEYGFILRYPSQYTHVTGYAYEPWHWRYVGADAATAMKDGGYDVYEKYWGEFAAPAIARAEREESTDGVTDKRSGELRTLMGGK